MKKITLLNIIFLMALSSLYAQTASLKDYLIAHYPFNAGKDSLQNAVDLTTPLIFPPDYIPNPGATPISRTPVKVSDRFNNPNSAFRFQRTHSIITEGEGITIGLEYTFSAWVKVDQNPTDNENWMIIMGVGGPGNDQLLTLDLNNGINAAIYITNPKQGGYTNANAVASPHLPLNTWTQLASVRTADSLHVYINGKHASGIKLPYPSFGYSNDNLTIGSRKDLSHGFKGSIDDVKIYDVALTRQQMQEAYEQEKHTTTSIQKSISEEAHKIELYPNPVTEYVQIKLPSSLGDLQKVEISNLAGVVLLSCEKIMLKNGIVSLKNTSLESGVYMMHIQTDKGLFMKKLIK